jgi:excisionase family DNA binding protein
MSVTTVKPPRKARRKSSSERSTTVRSINGAVEVLTLAEAAEYLRTSEAGVLDAIEQQDLPVRRVGQEWRILKSAIEQWLLTPQTRTTGKAALQSLAGVWKADPTIEPMLEEVYRQRGRPMLEKST